MAKQKPKRKSTIQHQEPPVAHQEPPIQTRNEDPRRRWPEDQPLPDVYEGRLVPCPNCLRVYLDTWSRATVCQSTRNGQAYLRCRACGHQWAMKHV